MHGKMQQNPPCELSGCFSTVSFSQVIPKSGDSLKESVFLTGKINSTQAGIKSKIYQKNKRSWM